MMKKTDSMKNVKLSIVITAHNEGILLHKTLRSVFAAAEGLKKKKITYEIIIHVDNGDAKTLDYLKRYKDVDSIIIAENNFGDLGQSRNYAVSIANGEYVSFLDGDDLISSNWYVASLEVLEKNKGDCVVYPEAVLTFQDDNHHVLTIQKKFNDTDEDRLVLLSANPWGSVVTAKKKVFLKIPYVVMKDGYCYEDYMFNIQTIEQQVAHLVAPETVLFYRRSKNSMLSCANDGNLLLPRAKLFALDKTKERFKDAVFFDYGEDKKSEETLLKEKTFRDNYFYKKVRGNWFLNYIVTPFLRLTLEIKKRVSKNKGDRDEEAELVDSKKDIVPEFVLKQWKDINKIEIQLYPTSDDISNVILYDVKDSIGIGKAYAELSKSFTQIPDYIFIVPWLVMGGADKVLLNYIDAIKKIHPKWHIAVITSLTVDNKWADRLPESVDLFELGKVVPYLSEAGVDVLLSRLIIQLECKRLHIINSQLGYRWVDEHSLLVSKNYEVYVSFFADEYVTDESGSERIVSFENPCLFNIMPNVKTVFTDNEKIVKKVVDRNAFDEKKFKIHYQPVDFKMRKNNYHEKRKKILWAGRIDIVKMPELVIKIAEQLDGVQIDVYGVIANECYDKTMFENCKNVKYCGEYKSFDEIPTEDYDLFLYTSKNDGIPNTILEATAAGLPIIASNDGGVGEFIVNGRTGILIDDFMKPEPYVKAISDFYCGKHKPEKLVSNAQELLQKRHSFESFLRIVKRDLPR